MVATRNSYNNDDGLTRENKDFNNRFILADASNDQAYSTNTLAIDMDSNVTIDPIRDSLDNIIVATNSVAGM